MEVEYPVRDLEHVPSDEEDVDEEEKGSRRKSKKSGKVVAKEHKDQLQRLKEKDPDFFKYLEEHDKELLEFDDEDFEEDGDTDVEDADMLVDEEIRDHDIAKKKEKPSDNVITTAMVESWCNSVRENGKISAVRSLLKAFRIACHYGDDGGGDASAKYTIMSSSVFNKVMLIVLTEMDGILRNVLGLPAYGGKKETVDDLLHTKKWMNYHHLAKSYLGNALYVLNQMTDTQMISFTLRRLKFSSVLLVAFPALLRKYIKVALHFWSTGEGVLPLVAFFFLRDICIRIGSDCLDDCFKGIYKAYVLNCHFVNAVKLQYIQFRANCVIELLGVDLPTAYQHAFVFIRQLAMILRDAITMKTKDSFRKVYEWKFMNCLELWTGAICTYSSEADLRPLAYPLTQIISGVARLVPTARYIPLRLRCVRMLNRIAASTGTFIPVSMLLLDMLEMKELDRPPTGGVGKAIDLRNELKVNKSTLKTRAFQEACVFSVVEELAEHLAQWSYSVAFFELSFIPAGRLRSFCKTTKIERFRKQMRELIRSIEANSRFTNEKRMSVTFLPNDPAAASFLEEEKKSGVSPLSQYVTTMREIARQRIDSLTESSVLVGEHSSVFRKKMPESDEDDDDAVNEKGAVVFSSSWLPGGTPEAKPSKKEKKKKKRKAEHQEELASDEDVVEDLILSSDDDGSVDDSTSDEDEIPKPLPSNPQSNKQERPTNLSKKKSFQKKLKTNSSASDSSSKGNVDKAIPSPKQHRKKQKAPAKSSKKGLPSHAKKSKKRKISNWDSLIQFDKPKCRLKAADVYSSFSCHHDDLSDLDNRIRECLSENHCNYCSQPLPSVCYQSQKEVDILLCSDCFHEGRFVTGHSSLDFIKVDSTKDYGDIDGESWSDQETLLLLEAMEIYNENWNEIAEHVGTKSKAQCILHFLRLPVEDGLLENIEVPSLAKSLSPSNRDDNRRPHSSSNGSCVDAENRLPFANSGNPVMALVAFLASAVGPRVAAACAHASLEALSADNRMGSERLHSREGGFHGEVANSIQLEEDSQHGSRGQNGAEVAPLSTEKVKAAAIAGLAAAATKAKLFADHEEREIQRLSANIINHQLKRLELKLKQFAEVETFLMRECEQVEKTRQRFAAERVRMLSTRITPTGVASQMNSASVAPSMVNNNVGNSRQQVMPSSSQPSISGYGSSNPAHPHNNQQVHSHMSYMQRGQPQPMFPLGTRLPAAAIQPSSPAPSNVMYNASGNSQPNLNQMLRSVSGPSSGLG